jgi:hypothetical protein
MGEWQSGVCGWKKYEGIPRAVVAEVDLIRLENPEGVK